IGQKRSTVAQLVQILSEANTLEYSILVAASAQLPTPPGIALSEPSQEWPLVDTCIQDVRITDKESVAALR
ncbi:hypothetical protein HAX54_026587, partial [Datura stramonium]|nr:hypothetical protein [Datura stramonium]